MYHAFPVSAQFLCTPQGTNYAGDASGHCLKDGIGEVLHNGGKNSYRSPG